MKHIAGCLWTHRLMDSLLDSFLDSICASALCSIPPPSWPNHETKENTHFTAHEMVLGIVIDEWLVICYLGCLFLIIHIPIYSLVFRFTTYLSISLILTSLKSWGLILHSLNLILILLENMRFKKKVWIC